MKELCSLINLSLVMTANIIYDTPFLKIPDQQIKTTLNESQYKMKTKIG